MSKANVREANVSKANIKFGSAIALAGTMMNGTNVSKANVKFKNKQFTERSEGTKETLAANKVSTPRTNRRYLLRTHSRRSLKFLYSYLAYLFKIYLLY